MSTSRLVGLALALASLVACGANTAPVSSPSVPLDADEDAVPDDHDACLTPEEPRTHEDRDGFEDDDGCAEPDNDGDAVLDVDDLCPNDAEDGDGFEDEDGCPDLDNDADRNPDTCDACPNDPETYNGECDEDGCPDCGRVLLIDTRLVILDRLFFERAGVVPTGEGPHVLDAIAATLAGNPQIVSVRVLGSVARGERAQLGLARAEAVVRELVARGVDIERLHAERAEPEGPHPRSVRFEITCGGDDAECRGAESGPSCTHATECRPVPGCFDD